jgi:hypothetical protein
MRKSMKLLLVCLILSSTISAFAEELAKYPVRWDRGMKTEYGSLIIRDDAVLFEADKGESLSIPLMHIDTVRITKENWIQLRTNRESGLSFGSDDTYNFGVIGQNPDPEIIERLNRLVVGARELRLASSPKFDGEVSRYMVSLSETVGDDVGLLIFTETGIRYVSDSNGRNHHWSYADLNGVELDRQGALTINTNERAIIKLGLSTRNYQFFSVTKPFKTGDIAFVMEKILNAGS